MKRVALGMSGGIDSTMSALILRESGYEVIGINMVKWDAESGITEQNKHGCFGPGETDANLKAEQACHKLGIPYYKIDLRKDFQQIVLTYFKTEFLRGRTPNPCVICNRRMKFALLPAKARSMGLEFDYFATGHYARIQFDETLLRWQLIQGIDSSKDQSYFLGFLSQEQLSKILFPLGNMLKSEIREYAVAHGYEHLTNKRESQDFLETDDPSPLFPPGSISEGNFINSKNEILGKHRGIIHYTIGQRKHLGIAGFSEPMYVVSIHADTNTIVLGTISELSRTSLVAEQVNWISISPATTPFTCQAKIRQAHTPADCIASPLPENRLQIDFNEPQQGITPGQLVALYQGPLMLAAGFIA